MSEKRSLFELLYDDALLALLIRAPLCAHSALIQTCKRISNALKSDAFRLERHVSKYRETVIAYSPPYTSGLWLLIGNSWRPCRSAPIRISTAIANEGLLLACGWDINGVNFIVRYNPSNDEWLTIAELPLNGVLERISLSVLGRSTVVLMFANDDDSLLVLSFDLNDVPPFLFPIIQLFLQQESSDNIVKEADALHAPKITTDILSFEIEQNPSCPCHHNRLLGYGFHDVLSWNHEQLQWTQVAALPSPQGIRSGAFELLNERLYLIVADECGEPICIRGFDPVKNTWDSPDIQLPEDMRPGVLGHCWPHLLVYRSKLLLVPAEKSQDSTWSHTARSFDLNTRQWSDFELPDPPNNRTDYYGDLVSEILL